MSSRGAAEVAEASKTTPRVVVLGTAQDGGLPQLGSEHAASRAAWADLERRRLTASLLIVDPRSHRRWLIDATPDLREQVERARQHAPPHAPAAGEARPNLFDGIFLTHAHIGHYAGLLQLGREAYGAHAQPVHASASMIAFLLGNEPWRQLVTLGNIALHELRPDQPVSLAADLSVTPFSVPHRAELSDTLGFVVRGPTRALVYVPDIDLWEQLLPPIEERIATADIALLDGTFHSADELPDRDQGEIPHPPILTSLARFTTVPADQRRKIVFTHLNHTNPATDPTSPATATIHAAGCTVAHEGQIFNL